MIDLYDLCGLGGVFCALYGYARVQWQRDFAKTFAYSFVNFTSAVLLSFSLWHRWNLASFIGNIIWGFISLYGLYRCFKYRRQSNL